MKANFSHALGFTFLLMTVVFFSASAQEGIPNNEIPDPYFYPELSEEKPLLFEPERSTSNTEKSLQGKDQLNSVSKGGKSKTGDTSKNSGVKTKTEEDALSFNFLYYIIQKFKISDIVEQ
jgi:hypothetical protein